MSITMYQSDRQFVTPANDASLYSALGGDTSGVLRRGNHLNITVSGLQVTVDTGQAIVLGRLVEVTEPVTFTLPASATGNVVIGIDLSKANTVMGQAGQANYQVKVNQVYLAGITGDLVQEDINNGGYIYQLPIATFTSQATTATVNQNNPMLNDSGWLNMDTARTGARLWGNPSYAQYRVRDNVVFLRWRGVDVTNSVNGNQVGYVPASIRPDVDITAAGTNIDSSGNQPITAVINEGAVLWINYSDNHRTNVHGMMSYPI